MNFNMSGDISDSKLRCRLYALQGIFPPNLNSVAFSYRITEYRVTDIQLISDSGRRHLRSASDRRCVVTRTQNTFGDRSFFLRRRTTRVEQTSWVSSEDISYMQTIYRQQLKSFLFRDSYVTELCD